MNGGADDFERNVFVNCPFDSEYRPLLWAMLFTLKACGLEPRIASEKADSGEVRFHKIVRLIKQSKYCVHDISRMDALAAGVLPRFNMPFELGLDLGLRESAVYPLTEKRCAIFDTELYRFQKVLSDLAGNDIKAHNDSPDILVKQLRTWLVEAGIADVPGGTSLWTDYGMFAGILDETLRGQNQSQEDITRHRSPQVDPSGARR
jgi:hypothetical protein